MHLLLVLFAFFVVGLPSFSAEPQPAKAVPVQYTSFDECHKMFTADCEKLFMLTLASISNNGYKIVEIQSKGANIIFTAEKKNFLASISKVDTKSAMLRITPADNSYNFPSKIPEKVFRNIVENISKSF